METISTIKKALSILKNHDFYYMMDDYAYSNGAVERAKASMRNFVKVTDTLPSETRQMLRDLWIATYDWCACFRPMWTASDYKVKEDRMNEIKSKVESLILV